MSDESAADLNEEIHATGPLVTTPVALDGAYRPLRPGSLAPSVFLGALAILFPPIALIGVWSARRSYQRTDSWVWPTIAALWNLLAACAGAWLWTTAGVHLLG